MHLEAREAHEVDLGGARRAFARGERIAAEAEQVDLDADPNFDRRFIRSLALTPEAGK